MFGIDTDNFWQRKKHVFQPHVFVSLEFVSKVCEHILGFTVLLMPFRFLRELKVYTVVVHWDKSAWLSDFTHVGVLFKAVEEEVKKVVNLAKLDELLVILGGDLEHEVLNFVFQGAPGKLLECVEEALSQFVAAAGLH